MDMPIPEDINLTRALTAESQLRGSMLRSQTIRNVLFGGAAVALATGVAIAAIIWSYNQKLDIEALKLAISQMPELKVAAIAPLKLEEPAPLKLETGTVKLEEGGTVSIDPTATVGVKGTIATQAPVQPQVATQAQKTDEGDAIKREVTVFNSVEFGKGEVVTGWKYANGTGKLPSFQYCYFTEPKADGTEQKINLSVNRTIDTNARRLLPNADSALSKCVWFGG